MTPLDFAWDHVGDVLTAPNGDGGQCVDLANLWLLQGYAAAHVYHNAVDWANLAIPGFSWVRNTPSNYPSIGDLVVWGPSPKWYIGTYGHIALCMAADANFLLSFDQNYPEGSAAHMQMHDYAGVLGWQHHK